MAQCPELGNPMLHSPVSHKENSLHVKQRGIYLWISYTKLDWGICVCDNYIMINFTLYTI